MKKIVHFIISLFSSEIKGKPINPKLERKLKSAFKIFFEGGYDHDQIYETYIPIRNFEITDISFLEYPHKVEMLITLARPGILIGIGGRTIDAIKYYLNNVHSKDFDNKPILINIKESKLWH